MSANPIRVFLDEVRITYQRHQIMVRLFEAIVVSFAATTSVRTALLILSGVTSALPYLAAFPIIAAIYVVVRFPKPLSIVGAARLVDERLDLKDRLATTVEWEGKSNRLVSYLADDAAMHTRFAQTRDVVPPPKWLDRKRLWQWGVVIAALILWVIPLPTGLLVSTEYSVLSSTQKDPDTDPLMDEVDRLLEQIQALSPQVGERLQRDLAELKVGLRDRSLPQEDAASLLRHLEKRVESALANQQPTLEQGLLTQRGEAMAYQDQLSSSAFPSSGETQRLQTVQHRQEISTVQVEWDEEGTGTQPGDERTSEGDGEQSGHGSGVSFPAAGETGPEGPEGTGTGENAEDDVSHTGSLAGHGSGESGEAENFERPDGTRLLEHIPGQSQAGPIHTANIQFTPDVDDFLPTQSAVPGDILATAESDDIVVGVSRERIPFVHRDIIRRYFEHLEPDI